VAEVDVRGEDLERGEGEKEREVRGAAIRLDRVLAAGDALRGDPVRPIRSWVLSEVRRQEKRKFSKFVSSLHISHIVKIAPYASSYVIPSDQPRSRGPIHVTLALGQEEFIDEGMEWEEVIPNAQDVLDAVRSLRDGDGLAEMQVDLPWELGNGFAGSGNEEGLMIVVGT